MALEKCDPKIYELVKEEEARQSGTEDILCINEGEDYPRLRPADLVPDSPL